MSIENSEATIETLVAQQANLSEKTSGGSKQLTASKADSPQKSRRALLRKGLGIAVAVVGAGALSAGQALASGHPKHGVGHNNGGGDNPGNFWDGDGSTPAVTADGYNGSNGVYAYSDSGNALYAVSDYGEAIHAVGGAMNFTGTWAVRAEGGVTATCNANTRSAVSAVGSAGAVGVVATSDSGNALYATSASSDAIHAIAGSGKSAVFAEGGSGTGVTATTASVGSNAIHAIGAGFYAGQTSSGVFAEGGNGAGVTATANNGGVGVVASGANNAWGVLASSDSGYGVYAQSGSGEALYAQSSSNNAIHAIGGGGSKSAVFAEGGSGTGVTATSSSGTALVVSGTMKVQGNAVGKATLSSGQKSVKVTTPAATTSSNIVLTPLNNYKGTVWVTLASGSFTINSSVNQTSNVGFTYLIIN